MTDTISPEYVEKLYEKALHAINELFGEVRIPKMITREKLEELMSDIKSMLDALGD